MRKFLFQSAIGLLVVATPATAVAPPESAESLAQPPKDECEAPMPPTGVLAPWLDPTPMSSVKEEPRLNDAQLRVGQSAFVTLYPANEVRVPVPGKPGGFGGLASVTITEAGKYSVALGSPGWIDIVSEGKAIASNGHAHGPECSTIRKIIDFDLKPGRHTVMISANPSRYAQVIIVQTK